MRFSPLIGVAAALLITQAALPARAGLIATPANTVNALFFVGAHTPGDAETEDFGSPPVAGPAPIGPGGVDFVAGANDESTIHVGDTQIATTNQASLPFCSTANPCADSFTGFEFQFSSGVDITGVTVDPASAADFRPVAGGLTFTPTDILLNVAGDAPAVGDELILDLTFPGTTTPVPEPASPALLAVGLIGAWSSRRRSRRQPTMMGAPS